ncbi:leucine/isoleucine/valine transporter permease subunit [Variovorax sp. PBL-H6]|uniref:branched-chain amino acid ABC transporter permease n=1 Tax=Variovorax sp. PBL-H6 TaxID=434009 RepID=UPI0013190843|nr:branched-chain amino acid ABC transporter permease [Variovorax sp. PBL-H6]VTU38007.1 leucine/isoleucine/valine transporter permease subunit [Variovorax sp. PBL-H6]
MTQSTTFARKWGSTAGVLVVCFFVATVFGQFRGSVYTTSTTIGIYALLALPLGLLYGQGGTVSLAQGAFAAIGGYTTAILSTRYGVPPMVSLLPAVLLPALIAFVISKPILRLPELSLALVTLSIGTVVEVALQRGGDFTGSFIGINGIPTLPFIGNSRIGSHFAVWALVLLLVIGYVNYMSSLRGRALNAIRTDHLLAQAMGVSVPFDLAMMFSLTAGVAGLGGWFYAHTLGYVAPDSLAIALSANVLFMVVLGGRKSVLGPIVGAVFFTLASDLLPGTESQGIFFGTLLILVLLFSPDGLLSLRPLTWLRRRGASPVARPPGSAPDNTARSTPSAGVLR